MLADDRGRQLEDKMRRARGLNIILGSLAAVFGTALLVPVFC